MFRIRMAVTIGALCAAGVAQTFTSPAGYLATEGDGYSWMYAILPYYYQHTQIDNTTTGTPRAGIHTFAWRRDATPPRPQMPAPLTLDLAIRAGHGDWTKVRHGEVNDLDDLVIGSMTTVFTPKPVQLPDWRQLPPSPPAPFDLVVPLDTPFDYDGQSALIWQIQLDSTPHSGERAADGLLDPYGATAPEDIGTGCLAPGHATPMTLLGTLKTPQQTYEPRPPSRWQLTTTDAPASTPVLLAIGLTNPDLAIGVCTRMYSSHEVVLYKGTSGATGTVSKLFLIRHDPAFVGLELYVQTAALEPRILEPWYVFSQGQKYTYVAPPSPLLQVATGLTQSHDFAWPQSAYLSVNRAMIARLEQ